MLVPLVVMEFTDEVDLGVFDFVLMGILIFSMEPIIKYTTRKIIEPTLRLMVIGAILLIFYLIWTELAVGVFGTPFAGS